MFVTVNSVQARFASVADRLRADFVGSASVRHHGSRGTEREEAVARFLKLYLPTTVEVVHNAEIVTTSGDVSPQCDIVLIDNKTPRLSDMESHRIVPAESVYAVIEVKSKLTGPELKDSCRKIAAIKEYPRAALIQSSATSPALRVGSNYGSRFAVRPIFGGVFAYDSIKFPNLIDRLIDCCDSQLAETHPDGVWVLDRGMLVWGPSDGSGNWYSSIDNGRDREIRALVEGRTGDVLLGMIITLSSVVAVPLPPPNLIEYLTPGLFYPVESRSRWTPNGMREGPPSSWR
jgi:hypothetical protein